jgi:branched-chain amino acid transport system ATP-binding protein
MPLALDVADLELRFGGLTALSGVSLQVQQGHIASLIGPNGAGKTSLVNCVTGYYRPTSGRISCFGTDVTGSSPHKAVAAGLARTYQNIELFKGMSVLDNLLLGRHRHLRSGLISGGLYYGRARREELAARAAVEHLIDFLEIAHVRRTPVGLLPYGLQKRVELGRALAVEPRLLLLDEPMAGMNLEEKQDMARFILETREERGVTVLLIEHDMGVVMDISDHVVALEFGRVIGSGTAEQVGQDPRVIAAYLGGQRPEGDEVPGATLVGAPQGSPS